MSTADAIAVAAAKLMKRHPGMELETAWARARQGEISARALAHPEGLTKYAYTKGMTQSDAMAFWTDAAELGFVKLGRNDRGTNVFGWRSEVASEPHLHRWIWAGNPGPSGHVECETCEYVPDEAGQKAALELLR